MLRDLRFALRGFRNSPGFTAVALLTLVLGIGATTAIFSVVNAALLRSLPFDRPESLVLIAGNVQRATIERRGASYPDFVDWRAQSRTVEDMAAYWNTAYSVNGPEPERVSGEGVSPSYFTLLGARPILGRLLRTEEDRPGAEPVVILSHAYWQRRFGGDPGAVGRTLLMNNRPFTIVGVLAPGFRGLTDVGDLWVSSAVDDPDALANRGSRGFRVLARLKPGVSIEQTQAELTQICRGLEQAYPVTNEKRGAEVSPLDTELFGPIAPALLAVLGAAGLVLLIACANVAALLLGRAEARQREMALRTALGASRAHLRRQLIVEGLALTGVAGLLGTLLARWGADALLRFSPIVFPGFVRADLDLTVLAFTLGLSVSTGVLLGLAPLWQIDLSRLAGALKEEAGRSSAGAGRLWFRQGIVIAEVALALMLLVGAGLLIRSFMALMAVDPGFQTAHLLTLRVTMPDPPASAAAPGASAATAAAATASAIGPGKNADAEAVAAAARAAAPGAVEGAGIALEMVTSLRRLPGVEQVSAGSDAPLSGSTSATVFTAEGQPPVDATNVPRGYRHLVTPGFFATIGLDLLAGRDFTEADLRADPRRVIIVSERVAQRFWPGDRPAERALGKRIKEGRAESTAPWLEIVGVVADSRYRALPRNPTSDPDLFFPLPPARRAFSLLLRTRVAPESLTAAVRADVRATMASATVFQVETMEQRVGEEVATPRFVTWLVGLFAGVALLLAAIGVYGVMAQAVARRTREIGIRMALGADRRDIRRLVLGRGLLLIAAGVGAGCVGAILLGRVLRSLLFGVGHTDAVTFASVAALLTVVALAASWIPTWRATRVDPIVALRR